ncbi:MAG TPA: phospholipid carrier-dependent glycosyltransferase [Candidatus Moranbacteria bacterium]|nr:phospholipid carrier-dependent glycosyltransferase [Candidatus Moranbacteria bacterium]
MIKLNKKIGLVLLGAVLLIAVFLRFYNLGEKSFVADEFLGVNASYGYLQTGDWKRWDFNLEKPMQDKPFVKNWFDWDVFKGGPETYTRAWIYHWQIAQALKLLPDAKEWSYRVVSALWGVLSVLIVYLLAWKFTGKRWIGLIAATLLVLSPDAIDFSRKVRMYAMFMPIFFLLSYWFFKFLESKEEYQNKLLTGFKAKTGLDLVYLPGVILLGLLAMHLHALTANIAILALVYILVMTIREWRKSKSWKNRYSAYLLIAFLGIIGLKIFFKDVVIWGVYFDNEQHFSYFSKILTDYSSLFLPIGLFLAGGWWLIKEDRKSGWFLLTSFMTILILAVFFWNRSAGEQYIFFLKPFQVTILATGIYAVAKYLKDNFRSNNNKIFYSSIVILILVLNNWSYYYSVDGPYKQKANSDSPNYRKIFSYVVKEKKQEEVLITRNFRNFYWQGSQSKVYSLGGERAEASEKKIDLISMKKIIADNPAGGWIVLSENDRQFISKEVEEYLRKNLDLVSNSFLRGPVTVYHWETN